MIWQTIREGVVEAVTILVVAGRAWSRDNGSRMAASLAFYAAFAIAPLTMLVMGVATFVFDEEVVQAQLAANLHEVVGPRIEAFIWDVIGRWQESQSGLQATLVALVALGWSAFRGFDALRATLNMLWGVEKRSGVGISDRLLRRAGVLIMMVCVGLLTVASIFYATVIAHLANHLEAVLGFTPPVVRRVEFLGYMFLLAVLFAMIFKWAANVELAWRDAIVGALFTAFLFALGRLLVTFVLLHVSSTSVFGAAGAMVALLLWVYLSAMIFFYGAEVTKYWAIRHGEGIRPDSRAVRVEGLQRVRQAIADALGEEAVEKVDRELGIDDRDR